MTRMLAFTASLLLLLAPLAPAQDRARLVAGTGVDRAVAETLSLTELAAIRFNRDTGADGQQRILARRDPVFVDPARHAQLIAGAGLTSAEARGLTLVELAAIKHNADTRADDRQREVRPARPTLMSSTGIDPAVARALGLPAAGH